MVLHDCYHCSIISDLMLLLLLYSLKETLTTLKLQRDLLNEFHENFSLFKEIQEPILNFSLISLCLVFFTVPTFSFSLSPQAHHSPLRHRAMCTRGAWIWGLCTDRPSCFTVKLSSGLFRQSKFGVIAEVLFSSCLLPSSVRMYHALLVRVFISLMRVFLHRWSLPIN